MKMKEYSDTIREKIGLETYPVGVKLYKNKEEIPTLEKVNKTIHCQAIQDASKGKSFYATNESIGCPIGAGILGLKEIPEDLTNGTRFEKMKITSTEKTGEKFFKKVPKINEKIEAIAYEPIEKENFTYDVIIIVAKPKQIFNLIKAYAYENGERVITDVGGTQSFCGDITVKTCLTDKPQISYGCVGSHLATDLKETEVVMSIPVSKIEELVNSLKQIKTV